MAEWFDSLVPPGCQGYSDMEFSFLYSSFTSSFPWSDPISEFLCIDLSCDILLFHMIQQTGDRAPNWKR